jgi:tetratricopeptide (TPR) repeat protein
MTTQIEERLDKARELRRANRHQEALEILREIVVADPTNADAWWITGLARHSLGRIEESLTALRETLKHAPRFASGWAQYGVVLGEAERADEAKKALAQALRIDPRHVFALRQLARICEKTENYDGQIQHLTTLDALGQADANDLNQLGIAHKKSKHFSRAIEYYLRSAAADPDPAPYYNLSLLYSHNEVSQDVDAVDSLYRALRLKNDYAAAKTKLDELTSRLANLANECLKTGETLLYLNEWFQFYVNPFELLGATLGQTLEDFDQKTIQKLKRRLLQEMELDDGAVSRLEGCVFDKSRVIGLCDELHDENLREFHWKILQNPFLLWFLTRGDIRLFLYRTEDYLDESVRLVSADDVYRTKHQELAEQLTDSLSNILLGEKIPIDVVNAETGEIIIPANRKITKTLLRKLALMHDHIEIDPSPIRNKIREIIQPYKSKFEALERERQQNREERQSQARENPHASMGIHIIELLNELDAEWSGFKEWLSEPFARQYNLVLTRALERGSPAVIEALFDGRRWVLRAHEELCFSGAHRHVARLVEPLQEAAKSAKTDKPSLADVQTLLSEKSTLAILNLLPEPFRDQQAEAVRAIRDIAIAAYNQHNDLDLSKAILALSNRFNFKSAELTQRLEEDFQQIQKLIAEERKHEVKLTQGEQPMEITKEGVRMGSQFFGAKVISSVRWGILVTGYQNAPTDEFLLTFRDEFEATELTFSWRSSSDLTKQEQLFGRLVDAALNFIVPNVLGKIKTQLEERKRVRIGSCVLTQDAVSFETKGWLGTKAHTIPWNRLGTEARNGILTVYDQATLTTRTTMVLRNTENAIVLQILAAMKRNEDS